MDNEIKKKIAHNAASEWCNCYKCDGFINETGEKCAKPGATCWKWYDGYRTAMIAIPHVEDFLKGEA